MTEQTLEQRFWERVEKTETCWLWKGATFGNKKNPHPAFHFNGRNHYAYRIVWLYFLQRTIPQNHYLLHKCDTPLCVNPDHLFTGTQTDNMRDCASRGRYFLQRFPHKATIHTARVACGELGGNAKLTAVQVKEIRALRAIGATTSDLAKRYSVNVTTIRDIVSRRTFKILSGHKQRDIVLV